jgi:hypothetical protein
MTVNGRAYCALVQFTGSDQQKPVKNYPAESETASFWRAP